MKPERVRLIDQVARSKQPFRSLVELTADAIFCYEYDPPISTNLPVDEQISRLYEGVLADCNDACARTYGATKADEVIGKRLGELFPKTDDSVDELYRSFIEDGYQTIEGESVEVLPNGKKRFYLNNAVGFVANDALVRIWGTWRDITERKKADQALREAEARTRALLDANPDLVFRVDGEGRYLDFHAGDPTLLAVRPEDFVGHKASEFFDRDFVRESQHYINTALDTGEMQYWEYQLPIQGTRRDFEARFVRSGKNEVVATIRDITKQAELEREIIAISERERSRIGHDLHDGLGQILTGVSLGLMTWSKRLSDSHSPDLEAVQHLSTLVQNAIAETRRVARLLSPGISSELGLGVALIALAEEINKYPGVTCSAQCSDHQDTHDIEVETHLYRIAQESVNNALRHGKAETIDLHYRSDDKKIRLEILDDGRGIPPEEDCVEGLGLRIMRYRARMINGNLEVTPRSEGGTRVLCSCPSGKK